MIKVKLEKEREALTAVLSFDEIIHWPVTTLDTKSLGNGPPPSSEGISWHQAEPRNQ